MFQGAFTISNLPNDECEAAKDTFANIASINYAVSTTFEVPGATMQFLKTSKTLV